MITVVSNSPYLHVRREGARSVQYPTSTVTVNSQIVNSHSTIGNVKFDTTSQQLMFFDGNSWTPVNITSTITTSDSLMYAMEFIKRKMVEDKELEERIKTNITLRDAYEQFKMVEILTRKKEEATDGS